jgi:hypothetical protein
MIHAPAADDSSARRPRRKLITAAGQAKLAAIPLVEQGNDKPGGRGSQAH